MSAATIPDVLVTTDWVAQHAADTGVRVVEVDVDTTAYDQGHVPGAAGWNWTTELCDTLIRDIVPIKKLEELLGKSSIDNKTTIVTNGLAAGETVVVNGQSRLEPGSRIAPKTETASAEGAG